jgi:hypothetical protein
MGNFFYKYSRIGRGIEKRKSMTEEFIQSVLELKKLD